MPYLKRKIDQFLAAWKTEKDRKPLIVKGARQVGKTESVRRFGEKNYKEVIYINFVEEPKYKMILEDGYKTEDIIKNFSEVAISGNSCISSNMISGSLLGISYKRIESNSVGYKTDYEMTSMDFEEFLWAKGYGQDFTEDLLVHMTEQKPLSDLTMAVCRELFLDFCILGGMPAVVRQYIERGTFEGTLEIQRQLIADYREDIRKYAEGLDQTRILNVFDQIAPQLAKENKKFQISKVAKGARFKEYRGCVEWLRDAGLVNICYGMAFPELPLKGNYDASKFKLYFSDTGILVAMLDDEAQDDLRANRNLGVYKGALYENIVGEALTKSGYGLYYYKRDDSTLEEDFFVRTKDLLVPVEVKAVGGRAKSLRTLISSEKYSDIKCGIKLCDGNIGYSNGIYTFPYFCTFLLKPCLREGTIKAP